MKTTKTKTKPKNESSDVNIEEIKNEQNVLKVGYFQLQTKSFWISLVSILCLFLLAVIWTNIIAYNKIINKFLEHEQKTIEIMSNIGKK